MPPKELPRDRVSLEHLLTVLRIYSSALGPIRNQVRELVSTAADLLEGDTSDYPQLSMVMASLGKKLADGLPPVGVLADYLTPNDAFPTPKATGSALDHVKQLTRVWTANGFTEEQVTTLAAHQIANFRDSIEDHAERVGDLERRLIERLAVSRQAMAAAEMASAGADRPVPGGVSPGAKPDHIQNSPKSRGRGAAGRQAGGAPVGGRYDRFALAKDAKKQWHLFERIGRRWAHRRPVSPQPPGGRVLEVLDRFLDEGGYVERLALMRIVRQKFSSEEGKQIYRTIVKPTLTHLRNWIREVIPAVTGHNPIRWEKSSKSYRLVITVGHATEDDDHRVVFMDPDGHAT